MAEKMRVLHINTELNLRGGERQVLYLVSGLAERGITAHLLCQPHGALARQAVNDGLAVFPFAMHGDADFKAAIRIARLIKREQYDIVHSHTPHAQALVLLASMLLSRKPVKIVTRRVQFSIYRHNFLGLNRFKYIFGVDHIIAISEQVKATLMHDGIPHAMITVVHSGVDVHRFKDITGDHIRAEFSIPRNAQVIGCVGFLEENKGHQFLIRAVREVVDKLPTARLFILGSGRMEAELKALTKELHLEENVILTGFRDDVGAFIKSCDLFAVPSIEEGLNSSLLDALALQIPVVASDTGGIPEIITANKTGLLVPPADPKALASRIIWMLEHREEARKMACAGQAKVRAHFSKDVMVDKNIGVYQDLLRKRRS